jgi:hypothetical protein
LLGTWWPLNYHANQGQSQKISSILTWKNAFFLIDDNKKKSVLMLFFLLFIDDEDSVYTFPVLFSDIIHYIQNYCTCKSCLLPLYQHFWRLSSSVLSGFHGNHGCLVILYRSKKYIFMKSKLHPSLWYMTCICWCKIKILKLHHFACLHFTQCKPP